MINVDGTTRVAATISKVPRIKVIHMELSPGVGLQARAHLFNDENEVRAITVLQTDTALYVSADGQEEGELIHLIVEATGNGQINVSQVVAGVGPGDEEV